MKMDCVFFMYIDDNLIVGSTAAIEQVTDKIKKFSMLPLVLKQQNILDVKFT